MNRIVQKKLAGVGLLAATSESTEVYNLTINKIYHVWSGQCSDSILDDFISLMLNFANVNTVAGLFTGAEP